MVEEHRHPDRRVPSMVSLDHTRVDAGADADTSPSYSQVDSSSADTMSYAVKRFLIA